MTTDDGRVSYPEMQNWFFQTLDPKQRDGFLKLFGYDFGNTAGFELRFQALRKIHNALDHRRLKKPRYWRG